MKITCKCNSSCQLIRWSKVPCTSKSKIILVIDEIKEMESSTYFEIYENGLWNIFVVLSSTTTKKKFFDDSEICGYAFYALSCLKSWPKFTLVVDYI